jgi:hypothetical protein
MFNLFLAFTSDRFSSDIFYNLRTTTPTVSKMNGEIDGSTDSLAVVVRWIDDSSFWSCKVGRNMLLEQADMLPQTGHTDRTCHITFDPKHKTSTIMLQEQIKKVMGGHGAAGFASHRHGFF